MPQGAHGQNVEVCRAEGSVRIGQPDDVVNVALKFPVLNMFVMNRYTLIDVKQVGGGIPAGGVSGMREYVVEHVRHRSLSIGAGDMNHPEGAVRVPESIEEHKHALKRVGSEVRPVFVIDESAEFFLYHGPICRCFR